MANPPNIQIILFILSCFCAFVSGRLLTKNNVTQNINLMHCMIISLINNVSSQNARDARSQNIGNAVRMQRKFINTIVKTKQSK